MAVNVAVITGLTRNTLGTRDYVSSGFGTPQAAMVIGSKCRPSSNPNNDAVLSIGFTDGTRNNVMTFYCLGNNTYRYNSTSYVFAEYLGSVNAAASFDRWVTDGIRLNFTNPSTMEDYLTIVLFNGLSNAHANFKQLTTTGVNDITDPSFKPDLVFMTCTGYNVNNAGTSAGLISFGAAHNNSSDVVSQGHLAIAMTNQTTPAVVNAQTRDDSICGQLYNNSQAWKGAAQDFETNGFSINTGADSPGNDYIYYLALQLESPNDADVSVIDTATANGPQNYTEPGFKPLWLLLMQNFAATINNDVQNGVLGIGNADTANQYFNQVSAEDNASPVNTQTSYSETAICQLYNEAGSATTHDATVTSYNSDGYTLNYTKTDTTARKWLSVTLKDTSALPPSGAAQNAIFMGHDW